MATVVKRGTRYRAQVRVKGRSISRTFSHSRDARLWAADQERGIVAGRDGGGTGRGWYLSGLINRYLADLHTPLRFRPRVESSVCPSAAHTCCRRR